MVDYVLENASYMEQLSAFNSKLDQLLSDGIPCMDELDSEKKVNILLKFFLKPFAEFHIIYLIGHAHEMIEEFYQKCDYLSQSSSTDIFEFMRLLPNNIRNEIIYQSGILHDSSILEYIENGDKENFMLSVKDDPSNYMRMVKVCGYISFTFFWRNPETYKETSLFKKLDTNSFSFSNKDYWMSLNINSIKMMFPDDDSTFLKMTNNLWSTFPGNDCKESEFAEWLYYQYLLTYYYQGAVFYNAIYIKQTDLEREVIIKLFCNNATQEFRDLIYKLDPSITFADVIIDNDIFGKQTEGEEEDFFCDLHPTVIEGGGEKLAQLLNLMEAYDIIPEHNKLQGETLIYRLTGRVRPLLLNLPKIRIHSLDLDALYYIIRGIVLHTPSSSDEIIYEKIKKFFTGIEFPERVADIQNSLVDSFVKDLDNLYPGVFGEGAPVITKKADEDIISNYEPTPSLFKIPEDLFKNPEKYETDRIAHRRLKKSIGLGENDIDKLEMILWNLAKHKYISGDYETLHSFFEVISGFKINKRCDIKKIEIGTPKAAEAVCSVVKKLCEKPKYSSLKQSFTTPEGSKIEFKSPNDRNNDIQHMLEEYFPKL